MATQRGWLVKVREPAGRKRKATCYIPLTLAASSDAAEKKAKKLLRLMVGDFINPRYTVEVVT